MEALEIQSNGKTSSASKRRKVNIEFINNLSLEGLAFENKEKLIRFYKTAKNEEIFLQYPGKESVRGKNLNPRDFRPKISISGQSGPDLSFGIIWESFFDLLKTHSIDDPDFLLSIDYLITLFYKSAYLIDFKLLDRVKFEIAEIKTSILNTENDVNYQVTFFELPDNKKKEVSEFKEVNFESPIYLFNSENNRYLIDFVQNKLGNLCGMSIEGLVLYNDILGWNEDVKYYSQALSKGDSWAKNGTGKPNNLLTHISILGYIRNAFRMSNVLNRFARSRGVSAPSNSELRELFDTFINPELLSIS